LIDENGLANAQLTVMNKAI